MMYYVVKFLTVCENCGKKYAGFMGCQCPKNDSSLFGDTLNSMADGADAKLTKKRVENAVREHNYKDLQIAPGTCSACGSYQTWNPMVKPKKPEPNRLTFKEVAGYALGLSLLVEPALVILSLFLMLTPLQKLMGDFFILYVILFGFILSAVLAILFKKSEIVSDEEYKKTIKKYEEQIQRYNEITETLNNRTVRNLPDINLYAGQFSNASAYECEANGGITDVYGTYCPKCHKKLEGTVRWRSEELARARNHCCPWCGATLPSNIKLNVE